MNNVLIRQRTKARIWFNLFLALISLLLVVLYILDPTFKERQNVIAFAVGAFFPIVFFASFLFALIYSFYDGMYGGYYTFQSYYLTHLKNTDFASVRFIVNYDEIAKIEARYTLLNMFRSDLYANITITKTDATKVILEGIPRYTEVVHYLVENVARARSIPPYQIIGDSITNFIYQEGKAKYSGTENAIEQISE